MKNKIRTFVQEYIGKRLGNWYTLELTDREISKLKTELYDAFDTYSKENRSMYVCITDSGTTPPKYRHATYDGALKEARRLSAVHNTDTHVYKEVIAVKSDGTEYEGLPF